MKKRFAIFLAAACLLIFTACASNSGAGSTFCGSVSSAPASAYQKLTAEDAKSLLDSGKIDLLVDVRTPAEYQEAHIPGAINLPNEEISDSQPEALPDLDAALMVYCRSGVRSKEAADKLIALGYTNVRDMGGIIDWPYDTLPGQEPGVYPTAIGILSSFSATDLEGNTADQSLLEGYDLIMVNVWATYCGPCIQEMPDLGELAEEYAPQGVRVVGLVSDLLDYDGTVNENQAETARDIVASTGADYLHLVPSQDLLGLLSQITAVPTTFFVDSSGVQVGSAYLGARDKAAWATILDDLLREVQS